MAITRNVWLRGAKQKAGGMVFYQAQGETRFRELAATVRNPRTEKQMAQRVRWANLVNFYRANRDWMQRAFENKPQTNTDYNRFMSLNIGASRIYLTKSEANAGACVADALQVSEGTLGGIEQTASQTGFDTNIFTGTLAAIGANTTVAEFATALVNANAGLRVGDQLSLIVNIQQTNSLTGFPYVEVRKYEVLLSPTNSDKLDTYIPVANLSITGAGASAVLSFVATVTSCAATFVLSRSQGSKILVSSQSLVPFGMAALINIYSSPAQLQTAIDSYGQGTEVFLSSAGANPANTAISTISISHLLFNNIPTYANQAFATWATTAGQEVSIIMQGDLPDSAEVTAFVTYGTTEESLTVDDMEGNAIIVIWPAVATGQAGDYPAQIRVNIDGVNYTLPLDDDNELG